MLATELVDDLVEVDRPESMREIPGAFVVRERSYEALSL